MIYWNFGKYIEEDGTDEINDWLYNIPKKHRAKIKKIVTHLKIQKDMRGPYFSQWKYHEYLYRLKFKFQKDLYRIFGYFGPNEKEFTLLFPAQKIAGRLQPRNAVKVAEEKYRLIKQNRGYVDDFV